MIRESRAMKYWMKAAQLRAVAHDDECRETRETILQVADKYEEIAKNADQVERAKLAMQ